jgi:hypothetical protein
LQVRVLPGSPLLFNELAPLGFSLEKTVPYFVPTPGSNPIPLRSNHILLRSG